MVDMHVLSLEVAALVGHAMLPRLITEISALFLPKNAR